MKRDGKPFPIPMWVAGMAPVFVAAVSYVFFLSEYLPYSGDLSLAADCIHGDGKAVPFVWGLLLRLSWAVVPGSSAFRLGLVSAFGGVVAVWAFSFTLSRLLPRATALAHRNARDDDASFWHIAPLTTALGGLAFVFAPGLFLTATRCAVTTVAMAVALVPFALLSFGVDVRNRRVRLGLMTVIGLFSGLAAWENMAGVILLPIAFLMILLLDRQDDMRHDWSCAFFLLGAGCATLVVFFAGRSSVPFPKSVPVAFWHLLALSFVPSALVYALLRGRRLRKVWSQFLFFGVWGLVIAMMIEWDNLSCPMEYGRVAHEFVRGTMSELKGRKWIVSDGTFDAHIRFLKPEDVHLVSNTRRIDPGNGRKLRDWVERELGGDDDLLLAAEIGSFEFVREWMKREGAATNCVFMTLREPILSIDRKFIRPAACCWLVDGVDRPVDPALCETRWNDVWESLLPAATGTVEPAASAVRRFFAVQGNAIGCHFQDRGLFPEAWAVYSKAIREMDATNLSLLFNAVELVRGGKVEDRETGERFSGALKAEMDGVRTLRQLQSRLADGGRLRVSAETRKGMVSWRERMRVREKENGEVARKRFLDVLAELDEISRLPEFMREKDLVRLEATFRQYAAASPKMQGFVNLVSGEINRLRGKEGLEKARDCFRRAVRDDSADVKLASERLLAVSVALHDSEALEYDALLVLHQDINHALANALLGSVRLERGECASAIRLIRRAVKMGLDKPGVKNDLALALSRNGDHGEAEKMIREVTTAAPDSWQVLDTMSEILSAAGKTEEAVATRKRAEEIARRQGQADLYRDMLENRERKKRGTGFRRLLSGLF